MRHKRWYDTWVNNYTVNYHDCRFEACFEHVEVRSQMHWQAMNIWLSARQAAHTGRSEDIIHFQTSRRANLSVLMCVYVWFYHITITCCRYRYLQPP